MAGLAGSEGPRHVVSGWLLPPDIEHSLLLLHHCLCWIIGNTWLITFRFKWWRKECYVFNQWFLTVYLKPKIHWKIFYFLNFNLMVHLWYPKVLLNSMQFIWGNEQLQITNIHKIDWDLPPTSICNYAFLVFYYLFTALCLNVYLPS